MKRIFALLLALTVILVCFTACGANKITDGNVVSDDSGEDTAQSTEYATQAPVEETSPAFPAFTSKTLYGQEVTEDALKGNKLTMVNIWGTFCGPCIKEMPDLEKISKDYAEKGVVVIGICADLYDYFRQENNADKIKKAEDIVAQTGVTYTNIVPSVSLNEALLDYINTFPTTYFINEKGEIIGEYVGSRSYDAWSGIIDSML